MQNRSQVSRWFWCIKILKNVFLPSVGFMYRSVDTASVTKIIALSRMNSHAIMAYLAVLIWSLRDAKTSGVSVDFDFVGLFIPLANFVKV